MKTATHKKLSDEEVIDKYLATQSSVYFSMLYDRYITKVYSKCISLLKNDAKAQDAAQEIFIKIFTNLGKFNKKSKFSTWVYSITYNFCIDTIRKQKKKNKLFSDEENEGKEIIEEVDDKVLLEMELDRLKVVLDLLTVDDKSVLIMKYKEGLSIRDISHVFGKTESAIKMKIKRAKHKCQRLYNETFPNKEE
ncbi:MAG: RNA polymerase sigma factor [Saprospiraceae bacterium]